MFDRRDILIRALQERHGIKDQSKQDVNHTATYDHPMTVDQAILIIQTAERARQGRHAARATKQVRIKETRMMILEREGLKSRPESAIAIQRIFRGYLARKKTQEMRQEELEFLGMIPKGSYAQEKSNDIHDISLLLSRQTNVTTREADLKIKNEKAYTRRKLIQRQNEIELKQQRKELREKILEEEGTTMMMDMKDAILERLILYQQVTETGGIPPFPSEKDGGSRRFMQLQEEAEVQALLEAQKIQEAEKDKKKDKGKKGAKKDSKKKGSKKKDDKSTAPKEPPSLTVNPATMEKLMSHMENILKEWKDAGVNVDLLERVDMVRLRQELIQGDEGIEEEIRKKADELVREELKNLKAALEVESTKTTKKGKKGKAKKGKKKVKKGAKEVDPEEAKADAERKAMEQRLANEALLEEFVSKEIVQMYPTRKVHDYVGQHRPLGSLMNHWAHPSMGQVRMSVCEVILTLGSADLHASAPYTKSLLLFGPHNSGKTLLVNIIASETRATLFNIDFTRMTAAYERTKASTMLQGVFALAKAYQPSVIFMDDVDLLYKGGKKKPPASVTRMRKELEACVGNLKPGQRVLFIGCSRQPWDCDIAVRRLFNKMIYTVVPDYGSAQEIWSRMIETRIERPLPLDFMVEVLSYISFVNGFASGTICNVVNQVLTKRRVRRLDLRPLKIDEFIGPIAKIDPVFQDEAKKYEEFLNKLSIRHRKRTEKDENEEKEFLAKLAEEKKAKKKAQRK